jgi:hypothetical protein
MALRTTDTTDLKMGFIIFSGISSSQFFSVVSWSDSPLNPRVVTNAPMKKILNPKF